MMEKLDTVSSDNDSVLLSIKINAIYTRWPVFLYHLLTVQYSFDCTVYFSRNCNQFLEDTIGEMHHSADFNS